MTAIDVFKQSLAFYSRIFNKIFWISFVSSLIPIIVMSASATGQPTGVELVMSTLASMFFSVYMMALIHQFSQDQNDSLSDAFSLTLKKVLPVTLTGFVFGLVVLVAVIPGAVLGGVLSSGIENEQLKNLLIAIVIAIPVGYVLYRCFFAAYFTMVDGLNPIEALKASNQQIKGNKWSQILVLLYEVILLESTQPIQQAPSICHHQLHTSLNPL